MARWLPQNAYAKRIGKGLNDAYEDATSRPPVEVDELRAVVFSDHHRGRGDGADDFRRCEEAYAAALGWYLEQGYELWLVGDVEELWENRAVHVMDRYEDILALEYQFGDRLWRFYGNHDMAWKQQRNVEEDLARYAPGTQVREALKLVITDGGKPLARLFVVHGHQGTIDSGNLLVVPFSRFVVRFGWAQPDGPRLFPTPRRRGTPFCAESTTGQWQPGRTVIRSALFCWRATPTTRSSRANCLPTARPRRGRRSEGTGTRISRGRTWPECVTCGRSLTTRSTSSGRATSTPAAARSATVM